jgi:hypothetical protein
MAGEHDSVPAGYPGTPISDALTHFAYAEASFMMMESLMLVLLDRKVLTLEDLTSAIETVIETKQGFVLEDRHPRIAEIAAGALRQVANSLAANRHASDAPAEGP